MWVLLLIIAFSGLATTAEGGAWAREKGQLFVSLGANIWVHDSDEHGHYHDPTLYFEYGLTDRITVGADYFATVFDSVDVGFAFAQIPLGDVTADDKFAVQLGYGIRTDYLTEFDPLWRGGLSWGRGLPNGWLAIDASAIYSQTDQVWRKKVDYTWGHHLTDRWSGMLQIQTGRSFDDRDFAKLAPAMIFNLNDTIRVSLGGMQELRDSDAAGIRLSVWQDF